MQGRSQLLPLLRTPLLGELLAWLYLHPERDYSGAELARILGVSASTISREADALIVAGLVTGQRRGNLRLLRADVTNRLARPLTELLALTYGPSAVLTELLAALHGVAEAYIYGSWAARYAGEAGPPPHDVDVLIVGDADPDDVADLARTAESRLGREVNAHQVSVSAWHTPGDDPFLTSVRSRPLFRLGDPDEVAAGP
ncbi:MarR family transcriptional regulator [Actinoplanes awajinensis]|uniref:ArsR family transcriptional regulator n=1 Tax=Actinoplanes awajinensis subsp. mycoplanecinus TaxID=135947 RepID=A0A124G9A0_9ACTN|nr:MarR family transcriptional regulator [Actinoplanes awajinensis]KUL28465.1 ArsR family transcriptional regulator [Actinoplanes awajinensis subsp. mycoplanecinus]